MEWKIVFHKKNYTKQIFILKARTLTKWSYEFFLNKTIKKESNYSIKFVFIVHILCHTHTHTK